MLTPKLSIRRANVMKSYGALIEAMHKGTGGIKIPQPASTQGNGNGEA